MSDNIPLVTVQSAYAVKDFIDAAVMKKDLAYNPYEIGDAMMQQSALFAHYGVLAAKASHQVDVVKMLLENTEAAVYKVLRDEMAAKGEKITEALLEKMVSRHARVIGMKKALNEAKRVEAIGKIATEGFRHRRDMLIQQAFFNREEMKGELRVAQRSAHDDALAFQKQQTMDRIKSKSEEN